jgi:hypothetical protein
MKRLRKVVSLVLVSTLVLLGLSFFPINDYTILASDDTFTPSPSPLIVEQFTGGWCGYCPIASACINWERLVEFTNYEFIHLAFHNGDQMAIAEGGEREKFYKIGGFPALVFGGIKKQEGWPQRQPTGDMYSPFIKDGISNQKSIADIYIKGSSEPKQFELKVKAKEDFGKRNINLVAVIYEDWVNILSPNGDAFHRNVVRNMPYGGLGRAGIKLKAGQVYEETRKFALQTKNWDNIGIVVYLQDIDNKEILGSGLFRYATKQPAIYYWGNEYKLMGEVDVKTCNNKIKFSVKNASELSEVFLKVRLDSLNYDLVDAKVSPTIGADKATIQFNGTIGEIRINLKEPVNGDQELFTLTIKFKQKSDALGFQIIKFVALDKNTAATPFELVDLTMFSYFKVSDNPYDLDGNLRIDDGDVSVLIERFGTMKKDKGFDKKCDLTKDGRIDMKDVTELMKNLDTRMTD